MLVQEDDESQEHIIYYLSWVFVGLELRYSHVSNLALPAVYVVQRLRHYILLRKTTIIVDVNPFQYVLPPKFTFRGGFDLFLKCP